MRGPAGAGFTLIDLMITLVVLAVLVAIAYPSYSGHLIRVRRAACMAELLNLANAMERHFTTSGTYLGAGTDHGGNDGAPAIFAADCPSDAEARYYGLAIQSVTSNTYTLRATPQGSQGGDGVLEVTQTGRRGWDRNGDDDTADAGEDTWER